MYARWRGDVDLVTILVRQGHPGPRTPSYSHLADKTADARAHRRDDRLTWPVLADDIAGTVHRAYGGLADPTFLIDRHGRVAFYNAVTHVPTLHRAVAALMARGGTGPVLGGYDRRPHLLAMMIDGWPALARGLPQSAVDLETTLPGSALLPRLGWQMRDALAPVALRSEPWPAGWRMAIGVGAGVLAAAVLSRRIRQLALAPPATPGA